MRWKDSHGPVGLSGFPRAVDLIGALLEEALATVALGIVAAWLAGALCLGGSTLGAGGAPSGRLGLRSGSGRHGCGV